jgi:diazepam-binding inhibitor (GABA receptor modulating acyl-CoA-binding protein)
MESEKTELERKFDKYISKVKKLESVSNDDKLFLYANYKQSLFGDNNNEKPSILNRVEMEKWKVWNSVKGISKEVSMKNYIKKVKDLYKNNNLEEK